MRPKYLSDIMDELGVSKFTIKILIIVGFAMIFDGFDYMVVSYTMPQIAAEWGLNSAQTGSLSSWSLIGLVIGGIVSGIVADKIGRKKTLIWGTVFYSILTAAVFFAPNYEVYAACRLLTGIGLGACIPMANTLNSEYAPTRVRGMFIAFGMAFMILGWVIAGLVALVVIPAFGWRVIYLAGIIPAIYAVIINFIMPESAMWLMVQNRKEEAIEIVRQMERSAGREPRDWRPEELIAPAKPKSEGVKGLFAKGYARSTLGIWLSAFCVASVMYGVNAWTPSMLVMTGFDTTSSYGFTIASNVAAMIATALAGVMIEKTGRIRGCTIAFIIGIIACLFMSFALNSSAPMIFVGVIFLGFAVNFATTCPKSWTPELYPTECRSTGSAFASSVGRIGGAAAPVVFGVLVGMGMSFSRLMLVLIIPLFLGMVIVLIFIRRETRGVSLEGLHDDE